MEYTWPIRGPLPCSSDERQHPPTQDYATTASRPSPCSSLPTDTNLGAKQAPADLAMDMIDLFDRGDGLDGVYRVQKRCATNAPA
jgi:hypothetical protein